MLEKQDIEKLAKLARIAVTSEEQEAFLTEIEPILGYVAQVKEVSGTSLMESELGLVKNIMREDTDPHQPALYTKDILSQAPATQDGYIKVKKILE